MSAYSPNLASLPDIRREMAFVYRKARRGKLPLNDAKGLVWMLSQLKDSIETLEKLKLAHERPEAGAGGTHIEIHQHTTSLSISAGILEEIATAAETRLAALAGEDRLVLPAAVSAESS